MPNSAMTELAIEMIPLDQIQLDDINPRKHTPAHVAQIVESIRRLRFNVPVIVDLKTKLLAGHGRVLACRKLGMEKVPAVRLTHLSEAEARAFAIAENRLVETGQWDEQLLGLHLQKLSTLDLDFSLEVTGFSMGEIDLKIERLSLDGSEEASTDDEPPLEVGPAVTRVGDIWRLGDHRLYCGSALEPDSYARLLLPKERIDAVFTDPPFNVRIDGHVSGKGKRRHREFIQASGEMDEDEFAGFLQMFLRTSIPHLKAGAVVFACMDWRHLTELLEAARAAGLVMLNLCVWTKPVGGMGSLYRSAHELVPVFRKGKRSHRNNVELGRHGRNRTNVWAYPGANQFLKSAEDADLIGQHPTPKPVKMVADALLDVTARGDLVLDPFMGAGSTMMAAERIGRRCRGIELDPIFVDLSIRRWQRMTGETAILESTSERFDVLAEAGR